MTNILYCIIYSESSKFKIFVLRPTKMINSGREISWRQNPGKIFEINALRLSQILVLRFKKFKSQS